MKYPQLEGIRAKAIEEGLCNGCQKLESIYFKGVNDCKYVDISEDSKSKENLGIQEKIKYEQIQK